MRAHRHDGGATASRDGEELEMNRVRPTPARTNWTTTSATFPGSFPSRAATPRSDGAPTFTSAVDGRWEPTTRRESAQRLTFLERARQRRIGRWMLSYLAVAWLVLQLLDVLGEIWGFPAVLSRVCSVLLGLGLYPAAVLSWFHGERGRQKVCRSEILLLAGFLLCASIGGWSLWGAGR